MDFLFLVISMQSFVYSRYLIRYYVIVSFLAGVIGTVQLIFFKEFWCKRFSDMELMLGGMGLFALAQLLVINWGPVCGTLI